MLLAFRLPPHIRLSFRIYQLSFSCCVPLLLPQLSSLCSRQRRSLRLSVRVAAAAAEARPATHVWTGRLRRSSAVEVDGDVVLAAPKRRRANVVVSG